MTSSIVWPPMLSEYFPITSNSITEFGEGGESLIVWPFCLFERLTVTEIEDLNSSLDDQE